jgi:flagellar assembly protein FliH
MSAIRKFLFDVDFTDHHVSAKATAAETEAEAEAEAAQELTEEEALPTFSEDELNTARDTGFKAGKEEGFQEAAAATEQRISETLAKIGEQMGALVDAQQASAEDLRIQAVRMAGALAKKVLPGWSEREGLSEIERLAGDLLERLHSEPRIVFTVSESLRDPARKRLMSLVESRGIEAAIEILGDPEMANGDCRVEWSDGGAERNTAKIIGDIDDIIARNTGSPLDDVFDVAPPAESIETAENIEDAPSDGPVESLEPEPPIETTDAAEETPILDDGVETDADTSELQDGPDGGDSPNQAVIDADPVDGEADDVDAGTDQTANEFPEETAPETDTGPADTEEPTETASEPTTSEADENPDGDQSPSDEPKPTN